MITVRRSADRTWTLIQNSKEHITKPPETSTNCCYNSGSSDDKNWGTLVPKGTPEGNERGKPIRAEIWSTIIR